MNHEMIWQLAQAKGIPVRAAYTPRQAALLLGIGKNVLYEAVRSGRVKALRVGRVHYIPTTELVKLLEGA